MYRTIDYHNNRSIFCRGSYYESVYRNDREPTKEIA